MSDTESPGAVAPEPSSDAVPTEGRRNMLVELLTGFLSFLLVAVPSTIGGIFFLDPLIRGRKSTDSGDDGGLDGYIKLPVTADSIPVDGTPVAVSVRTDQDDAWNRFKDVPVGSVWLRKNPAGEIIVFNSICPHLGCSVDYRRSENDFFCPCHTSGFDLDGNKTNDIPPRDMDTLEIAAVTDGQKKVDGNELWVKFQNFRRATAEKTPI
jgi:menaquinol-cytochrome c reductase iron-sulfur subunit